MARDARPRRWRVFIIVASYVFYGWWDWRFVFLLAGRTLWNHVLAVRIHRSAGRAAAGAARGSRSPATSCVLGYFKYYDFFVSSRDNLLRRRARGCRSTCARSSSRSASRSTPSWRSATSSTPTAATSSRSTLEKFAAYLSFFPHLVAGPIVRAGELIPQMETRRDPRRVDTSRAFYLIATGLFKKVVIANYLAAHIVDQVFAAPGSTRRSRSWSRSTPTPSRSTPTSPATPTWRSGSRSCSASSSPRTSTRRTPPSRSRTSGAAGT